MVDMKKKATDILEDYSNYYSQVDLETLTKFLEQIKSEAIKEFAERFRKELFDEIQKTIWNIDVPLEYEQNKSYVLSRVWRCIKNKLEELVGD